MRKVVCLQAPSDLPLHLPELPTGGHDGTRQGEDHDPVGPDGIFTAEARLVLHGQSQGVPGLKPERGGGNGRRYSRTRGYGVGELLGCRTPRPQQEAPRQDAGGEPSWSGNPRPMPEGYGRDLDLRGPGDLPAGR